MKFTQLWVIMYVRNKRGDDSHALDRALRLMEHRKVSVEEQLHKQREFCSKRWELDEWGSKRKRGGKVAS